MSTKQQTKVNAIMKRERENLVSRAKQLRVDNKNKAMTTDKGSRLNIQDCTHDPMTGLGVRPIIFKIKKTSINKKPLKFVANVANATRSYLQVFFGKVGAIFTFNNLLKIITIFLAGFLGRYLINDI